MRKLLILALAGLLALLPLTSVPAVPAQDPLTTAEAQYMVDTLGCDAQVRVIQGDYINGMFLGAGHYPTPDGVVEVTHSIIRVLDGPNLDHAAARMILLHEIGHCIDHQDDGIDRASAPWAEWYADEYAVEHAAQFGINPEALYNDLYNWHVTHDKTGSSMHGDPGGRLLHLRQQIDKRGYNIQGA